MIKKVLTQADKYLKVNHAGENGAVNICESPRPEGRGFF